VISTKENRCPNCHPLKKVNFELLCAVTMFHIPMLSGDRNASVGFGFAKERGPFAGVIKPGPC
jgi:hypothetical protein